MLRSQSRHKRGVLRASGSCVLLAISIGIAGCMYDEGGQLVYTEEFCGILYSCGSDSDNNRGGEQTEIGSSSSSSNGTSSTTSEGAATAGDENAASTGD